MQQKNNNMEKILKDYSCEKYLAKELTAEDSYKGFFETYSNLSSAP